jgi:membrane associated rhomboid family serine protease
LKNWVRTGLLSLAAAIGFSIAVWFTWDMLRGFTPQILGGAITLAIWGAIGGTCLGLTLGFLEKRKHDMEG